MSTIFLAEPGQTQPVSYPEAQARELWTQGRVSSQALYWREGMPDWRPAHEFFTDAPVAPPARTWAKDPTTLTKTLHVMLWLSLALSVMGALLSTIGIATGQATQLEVESLTMLDIVTMLLGLAQLGLYIATAVVFCMWVHRANRNARALGAVGMNFTPGWAVGWFFIPIMNLWKPFQAMREIWHASDNPNVVPEERAPTLVSIWWTLWLLTNFLGQMTLRLALRAETESELLTSEVLSLSSDLTDIALCIVAVKMTGAIYSMQKAHTTTA